MIQEWVVNKYGRRFTLYLTVHKHNRAVWSFDGCCLQGVELAVEFNNILKSVVGTTPGKQNDSLRLI